MNENTIKDNEENVSPFPGKIAVVTSIDNVDDVQSAERLVAKYGTGKIIHVNWPLSFVTDQEEMIDIVAGLAPDRDIKILIINQALPGTNAAIDKFREMRDDVFIVCCSIHESLPETAKRADLMFDPDFVGMGAAMVQQVKKQGAKVFVHYSFPRHMSVLEQSSCRDKIRETCEAENILFLDATVPDPKGDAGADAARQFITEDVPRVVAKYGEDTAFFCTNCALQVSLITAVVNSHAIYPQQCCPSPLHGFPEALGIETGEGLVDLNYVIGEISSIAAEKNMTDRLSSWPVSASIMFTNAGAEYAIKWIKGEVPRNGIDERVLDDCMSAYVKEVVGEGVEVSMTSYSVGGVTYDKCKLLLMAYLDY